MKNRPDDPHPRDTVLSRLLSQALDAQPASGPLTGSVCPDAEIIAAYAERGLAEEEAAHWDIHFAGCARCQKIIAALAVTADESDVLTEEHTEAEEEKVSAVAVGALHATAPVAAQSAATIRRRRTIWYWLVPAIGLTSVAALWFAIQPGPPPPSLSSQRIAAPGEPPKADMPELPAASLAQPQSAESQIAQSNLPPPPLAKASTPSGSLRREAGQSAANSAAVTAPALQGSARGLAVPSPEAEKKEDQVLSAQAAPEQKSETSDALTLAAPTAPAAPPSPARPNSSGEGSVSRLGGAAIGGFAGNKVTALDKTVAPLIVFGSPARNSLWRLGPGSRIEHSTDRGLTWQLQSSGVTADLLAGAAPSETIAWVVGRAGTILRTTDGAQWQPVQPPPGPASDWIKVEARDGLQASVTSRDLHRFTTEDGGRTWLQQQ